MAITPQRSLEANHPEQILLELQWILHTEPVWSSAPRTMWHTIRQACSQNLRPIAEQLAAEWLWHGAPRRLGRRFEALLTALFDASERIQLLTHQLPIRQGGDTLGELDFLIEVDGQVMHLEVAVKFYAGLGSVDFSGTHRAFVGPSCQDRLDRKVDHLLRHQLPLIHSEHGLRALCGAQIPRPQSSVGLIFGDLLMPWRAEVALPADIIVTRPAHWCLHRESDVAIRALSRPYGSQYGWEFLPRDAWIGSYQGSPQLPQHPKALPRPEQADCYLLISHQSPHNERVRLFVMQDDFERSAKAATQSED